MEEYQHCFRFYRWDGKTVRFVKEMCSTWLQ